MKYIIKFFGVVFLTIFLLITEFLGFLWECIWDFKIGGLYETLELTYTSLIDYSDKPSIPDLGLNYQPEKSDDVIYEEYKSTIHYLWGFKPLKVKHKNNNI
tara:strand:- start:13557 stop:13859 length:303 start_codon:yes stop_codon:yes gene_type:complete